MAPAAGADETVQVCGSYANHVFARTAPVQGITVKGTCPNPPYTTDGFALYSSGTSTRGESAHWQADAPSGLAIVGASTNSMVSAGLNSRGGDFGGGFYWAGGGAQAHDSETSFGAGSFLSGYFGFQLVCGVSRCTQPAQLDIGAISLDVRETSGPSFAAPTGLWQASGWVRGGWPFFAWGNSPSGLCWISATLNGELINTTTSAQDVSSWHQCAAPPISQPVDTSRYGQGAVPLTLGAGDAAGVPASLTKTVYIDNQQPTVALSGPTDAPSTAGTQYITATGAAGPSGVAGLSCSVDRAPAHWYPSSSAQVAVGGIGEHSVTCSAANNAVDGAGNHGWSAPQTWSLKIGVPTVTGIAFSRIVDRLRCRRARERVRVPAHWVTVRRHHHRIRFHRRAHTRLVRVLKCHARTVLRRRTVWIIVHWHGKPVRVPRLRLVHVIVPPHAVLKTNRLVGHGRATTVSGWLGTYNGIALGRQTVEVLTAPDNGSNAFTRAARVTTAANGSWSTTLPAGPSRLIEAAYGGGPTVESSLSGTVREIVPARVKLLSVFPRRVPWGGTVRIVGQLIGGYLPPGGALVRMRLGSGSAYTTYGVQEHVTGHGQFSSTYTFGAGLPGVYRSFFFQAASLPMGSYPYAPAASGKLTVVVGGHPAIPAPPRHHRTRRRHKRHR
ncbi:MAG: hypothetical protein ACR2ND_06065 [Solirubrobacteraceae bacterium]